MLQFWKKTGQTQRNYSISTKNNNKNNINNLHNCTDIINQNCKKIPSFDDEGLYDIDEFENLKEHSRLSKTLQDVLSDKGPLGYFMQFMESRNAASYLMCWLDIDAFKQEIQPQSLCTMSPEPENPISPSFKDHDSLSVSTDCDSFNSLSESLSEKVTHNSSCPNSQNGYCDISSDTSPKSESQDRHIDNALMIFKKYVAQEAPHNIHVDDAIRKETIENICDTNKVLTLSCFDKVQNFVHDIMEKEYFDVFIGSDHYAKHQIDVLTSGNVALEDILYNETALFYFMEFLEQENCRTLLEFWIAATNFQQQLHHQKEFFDPVEAQNDAVVLYDKYFSLQAHSPLGFGDRVRFAVEQLICGENGLIIECFHLPLKIVEQILERNYLKAFLTSQLFYKFLSELINTVQSNGYAINIERNRNHPQSDSSSEKSFSTNSTFLALEFNNCHTTNNLNCKSQRMSIDTRELYDPDSLWKRKKCSLSCGKVTELGKFETDLDPEPDRKEFKLGNVVKKFVQMENDKKKEEMAWQVAEMIVKDITNITLSQPSLKKNFNT